MTLRDHAFPVAAATAAWNDLPPTIRGQIYKISYNFVLVGFKKIITTITTSDGIPFLLLLRRPAAEFTKYLTIYRKIIVSLS